MAISYSRVSVSHKNSVSIAAQQAYISNFIKKSNKKITNSITEVGRIGNGRVLPGREMAVMEAKRKKSWIVIFSVCRLIRNEKQANDLWEEIGGRIISVTEEINSKQDFMLLAGMAQRESEIMSRRTKASLSELRRTRRKTGGDVPYGYDVDSNGILFENEEEQAAIDLICSLRQYRLPLRAITHELDLRGIRSKRGKTWSPQSINAIIKRGPIFKQ